MSSTSDPSLTSPSEAFTFELAGETSRVLGEAFPAAVLSREEAALSADSGAALPPPPPTRFFSAAASLWERGPLLQGLINGGPGVRPPQSLFQDGRLLIELRRVLAYYAENCSLRGPYYPANLWGDGPYVHTVAAVVARGPLEEVKGQLRSAKLVRRARAMTYLSMKLTVALRAAQISGTFRWQRRLHCQGDDNWVAYYELCFSEADEVDFVTLGKITRVELVDAEGQELPLPAEAFPDRVKASALHMSIEEFNTYFPEVLSSCQGEGFDVRDPGWLHQACPRLSPATRLHASGWGHDESMSQLQAMKILSRPSSWKKKFQEHLENSLVVNPDSEAGQDTESIRWDITFFRRNFVHEGVLYVCNFVPDLAKSAQTLLRDEVNRSGGSVSKEALSSVISSEVFNKCLTADAAALFQEEALKLLRIMERIQFTGENYGFEVIK